MTDLAPDGALLNGAGNEEGAPHAAEAAPAKPLARPRQKRQERMAQNFSNVVAVLMRDQAYRNLRLMDLEWLVLPPLMSGQWRMAQARSDRPGAKAGTTSPENTPMVPVAVALWATVSPEIDKRLSENLDKPLMLRTNEWASGNIPWLIAVAGDPRALPTFLKQLIESEFKDKPLKMRGNGPDGKAMVHTFSRQAT